jgi:hypothetical protein
MRPGCLASKGPWIDSSPVGGGVGPLSGVENRSSARVVRPGDHVLVVREAVPPVPPEPVWVGQVHIAADLRNRSLKRGWDGILKVSQPFKPLGHRPR